MIGQNSRHDDSSEAETVISDHVPTRKLKRLKRRRSSSDDNDFWSDDVKPSRKQPSRHHHSKSNTFSDSPVSRSNSPGGINIATSSTGNSKKDRRDANGRLKLQRMCDKGKYEEAKELILNGVDVNDRDYAGNTAIHEAALKGHTKIVELLIDNGAIIDIRSGPGDLDTPLIDAATNDHIETVKLLLDRGADPRIFNVQGKTSMDSIQDDKPNHDAIEKLLKNAVLSFKKKRHSPDNNTGGSDDDFMDPANYPPGTFPPNESSNNLQSVGPRRHGARAQPIRNDLLWMDLTTRTGRDQVYRKAADGDIEFVGSFLGNGWKPDADCLALAARHGHTDIVGLLLAFGAQVNGRTEDNETALQATIGRGHFATVKLLLDSGADVTVVNADGKSCLELAKESLASEEREVSLIEEFLKKKLKKSKLNVTSKKEDPVSKKLHKEFKESREAKDLKESKELKESRDLKDSKEFTEEKSKGKLVSAIFRDDKRKSIDEATKKLKDDKKISKLDKISSKEVFKDKIKKDEKPDKVRKEEKTDRLFDKIRKEERSADKTRKEIRFDKPIDKVRKEEKIEKVYKEERLKKVKKEEKFDKASDKPRDLVNVRLKKRPIISDDEEDIIPVRKKPVEGVSVKKHKGNEGPVKNYKSIDEPAKKSDSIKKFKPEEHVKKEGSSSATPIETFISSKSEAQTDFEFKPGTSKIDKVNEKLQDTKHFSEEPKSKEAVDIRREDEQKKQMLLAKRERERKEREKKMLLQLEADDEKRKKRLDHQRQQEKERLEKKKQKELLEIKQEKERQLSEVEANKPGVLGTAEQDLPLLGKVIRSSDYVIDMQLGLVLGLQNIYHSCE